MTSLTQRSARTRSGFALVASVLTLLVTTCTNAAVIVDDSWVDGGFSDGVDAQDTAWFTSASSGALEAGSGSMGFVTGGSGRGIHTVFPTQTLTNIGDKLVASYTFATPATIGTGGAGSFRVGLFDTLGRALAANITASSGSPNSLYGLYSASTTGLPGYMLDMDVNTPGTEDFNIRQLDTPVNVPATTPTGRLMGTSTGFTSLGDSANGLYTFAASTSYSGSLTITRSSATQLDVKGALGAAEFTVTDTFDSASFGFLGFWANSAVFGSSSTAGTADNGIDFTNVKIEFIAAVPEPAMLPFFGASGLLVSRRRKSER